MATGTNATATAEAKWHDADEFRWCVRHWATRMGVRAPQIHLRRMTTKWASLSTSGRLTLNSELLDLPREWGEFVIVHELVHLLVPNHGKIFKSFLHAYMPGWEQRERDLQAYAVRTHKQAMKAKARGKVTARR